MFWMARNTATVILFLRVLIEAKWLVWCSKISDQATKMRLSQTCNTRGGHLRHQAHQFSIFFRQILLEAYFHSHVINTFFFSTDTSLQHSKPLQAVCPCNFRPTWAEAVSSLMPQQSAWQGFISVTGQVYGPCESGMLDELNARAAHDKNDIPVS